MHRRLGMALVTTFVASVASPMPALAVPHTVTFEIDMRPEIAAGRFDPARDRVGVRGGVAPLSWHETAQASDPDGDGRYAADVTFVRAPFGGQAIAYKFKIDRPADPGLGWEQGRNRQLFLRQPAQRVSRVFDAPPEPVAVSRVGTIRSHPAFPSRFVAPRNVEVYLPPGYEREISRRYPVLYLQDGQNVFDGASMGMEWQVDETADALIRAGRIEPVIVVAVANTDARREEYAPTSVGKGSGGAVSKRRGKGNLYARFLVEDLKPFVDRTYRTRRDAASTAVGGASLGGLISLWLALERPEVFGGALAVSPAARWDDFVILKTVAALARKPPVRVWVDIGSLEGEPAVDGARRLRDALVRGGWKVGSDLAYVEQDDGHHDEISWASRVEGMLSFLYGASSPR